jgi:hypothetical protein
VAVVVELHQELGQQEGVVEAVEPQQVAELIMAAMVDQE